MAVPDGQLGAMLIENILKRKLFSNFIIPWETNFIVEIEFLRNKTD